ncbi:hypothetical protein HNQ69_001577 [Bartonella callosciuri]|uniref:Phage tail collar domain-containing protein n=1 Tax=Bartonella callosciuri TaxID=686223 RepID=A0A840NWW2_9HYPH|nr:phage tail protein [Bartonella callosciuri]MBB5074435.1 hypothetical protein [Bartonella callosciuri]
MSDIYSWSLTASENAGADSFINWSEGQPPHTVNNSARAMMQRVREYLSAIGGVLESTFIVNEEQQTTAITLQTKFRFLAYKKDIVVRFKAKGTNLGATMVALDRLEGKPVYKATETGIRPLIGGEIQNGCISTLVYDEEISGWQLLNPMIKGISQFRRLPSGFIGSFAMENLPDGWLLCDGSAYSRKDYRNLFATIGTLWGDGDGVTTFNIPDLRGMFLRGFDYLGAVDPGRHFASTQHYSLRIHEHRIGTVDPVRGSLRRKRDSSSVNGPLKRMKRSIIVDYEILDEECAGLTGDALERCERAFDSLTDTGEEEVTVQPEDSFSPPFFIKYREKFFMLSTPRRSDQELGIHEHRIMTESFGGQETRPINVSLVFGIKT